jgi:hypothetical protein
MDPRECMWEEKICIFMYPLLKYKMHLYLRNFIEGHLHATFKFKVQIYIYIALLEIA